MGHGRAESSIEVAPLVTNCKLYQRGFISCQNTLNTRNKSVQLLPGRIVSVVIDPSKTYEQSYYST